MGHFLQKKVSQEYHWIKANTESRRQREKRLVGMILQDASLYS
jgi:hypothetical protein